MSTFILTWNPARWHWADLAQAAQQTAQGKTYQHRWSTGNTKKIIQDDRVFLLKQGDEPRGIIAAGWVASEKVYDAPHYDAGRADQGDTAPRVDVLFERILNPSLDAPLTVEDIGDKSLAKVLQLMRASGTELEAEAADKLEDCWERHLERIAGPTRLSPDDAEAEVFNLQEGDGRAIVLRQIRAR